MNPCQGVGLFVYTNMHRGQSPPTRIVQARCVQGMPPDMAHQLWAFSQVAPAPEPLPLLH